MHLICQQACKVSQNFLRFRLLVLRNNYRGHLKVWSLFSSDCIPLNLVWVGISTDGRSKFFTEALLESPTSLKEAGRTVATTFWSGLTSIVSIAFPA